MYQATLLKFKPEGLKGISAQTIEIHHQKLYLGYVNKLNEITDQLKNTSTQKGANASYSVWRGLKDGESFTLNAVLLHELYFDQLGGNGEMGLIDLRNSLIKQFGSFEQFQDQFNATCLSSRGWVVLAWNVAAQEFRIIQADAHNQGAAWNWLPILICDVYEHAYFIDFGSDRSSYLQAFWSNLDWSVLNQRYLTALK